MVREFVRLSAENGIDVFRVFDALNDIRNLEVAIAAGRQTGKHAQGTICYTTSPVHDIRITSYNVCYTKLLRARAEFQCDRAADSAAGARYQYDLVIQFHSCLVITSYSIHYTKLYDCRRRMNTPAMIGRSSASPVSFSTIEASVSAS